MTTDISDPTEFADLFAFDYLDNPDEENPHGAYNKGEHDVIDKYKDRYLSATSASQRRSLAQIQIFPELFNYWKEKGFVYDKREAQIKANVRRLLIL
jgi:hypothetical protein